MTTSTMCAARAQFVREEVLRTHAVLMCGCACACVRLRAPACACESFVAYGRFAYVSFPSVASLPDSSSTVSLPHSSTTSDPSPLMHTAV
eukprot:6213360-Pleurochrysis_carterae.AAC.1